MQTALPLIVRVYGICLNNRQEVLVTDEYRLDTYMTKFPGGGLEAGEGTLDCLRRECREELGQEAIIRDHFYTTDYFQLTLLLPSPGQLISIYYLMDLPFSERLPISHSVFDFPPEEGRQTFRWVPLEILDPDQFTFPIDKIVALKLKVIYC